MIWFLSAAKGYTGIAISGIQIAVKGANIMIRIPRFRKPTLRGVLIAIICFCVSGCAAYTFLRLQRLQSPFSYQTVAETFLIAATIGAFFAGIGALVRDSLAVTFVALILSMILSIGYGLYLLFSFFSSLKW